jgi:biotin-[acetyl-CoA-carboxylase] ligase BirA-like protein
MLPVEIHLESVTSTNDYAKDVLRYYPFVMISADVQTQGRGRRGREWHSVPNSNITCSFGIQHTHNLSPSDVSSYMGRAALAVVEALRLHAKHAEFRLKYPNDIQARTEQGWSKIAGILVEHEFMGSVCAASVVGIGVNVVQPPGQDTISQRYTSLHHHTDVADVAELRRTIRDSFVKWLEIDTPTVIQLWERELLNNQQTIQIVGETGNWTILRLQPDGRLLLNNATDTRQRVVSDGDSLQYLD